jgi:hypothetical protein
MTEDLAVATSVVFLLLVLVPFVPLTPLISFHAKASWEVFDVTIFLPEKR